MKKVIKLTESDLVIIVKRVISEKYDSIDSFLNQYSSKWPMYDELKEYINKGCIKFDTTGKYVIYDVGAPYDFVDAGFEREDANRVKSKLRSKGFESLGVGKFVKEI
jgi:hypothetical protein